MSKKKVYSYIQFSTKQAERTHPDCKYEKMLATAADLEVVQHPLDGMNNQSSIIKSDVNIECDLICRSVVYSFAYQMMRGARDGCKKEEYADSVGLCGEC